MSITTSAPLSACRGHQASSEVTRSGKHGRQRERAVLWVRASESSLAQTRLDAWWNALYVRSNVAIRSCGRDAQPVSRRWPEASINTARSGNCGSPLRWLPQDLRPESDVIEGTLVPSLSGVATRYAGRPEALQAFIMTPHRPMPGMEIGLSEVRDLVAYIMSLN